jgi:chromosome segregation ATPase
MTWRQRPEGRTTTPRRHLTRSAAALVLAVSLAACSDEGPVQLDVDWGGLSRQVEQLADDAARTAEEVREDLAGSQVEDDVRARTEDAVTEAESAVEAARTRLEELQRQATPDPALLEDAHRRLTEARAELEAVTQDAEGALREGLETLSDEIDGLLDRLGEASP